MVHRIGALVITGALVGLAFAYKNYTMLRNNIFIILIFLTIQVALGVINVVMSLPMFAAVMHNAVALVLLLCLISLAHKVFKNHSPI